MTRLLLIEDDESIRVPLERRLTNRGFDVLSAADGKSGLEMALAHNPSVVILDLMMPEMDGWEVCRRLRENSVVPILMVSALSDEFDRIEGLELGADDYMTKPFNTNELIARINAILRRVAFDTQPSDKEQVLEAGGVSLNLETRKVTSNGKPLTLRHKEFELLALLMESAGKPVTRAKIFDEVWGTDWLGDTRTLDVHIRWLREKLEENPSQPKIISTVRNVGYIFNSD
ncbi:MAG: response regulator transcription factor [Chloroflexota bacterium]